jgi:Fe-S-cluster containining protein
MADSLLGTATTQLPVHILRRLPTAQAAAEAHASVINARLMERYAEFSERLRVLQGFPAMKREKLQKLRQLADEMAALAADQAACRKGCTHCCHIPVALVQSEANLIAKAIGRPAKQLVKSSSPESRGYGYHMPCPFLKDNACQIYEDRPLSCRIHFNLDDDALLCELRTDSTVPVPLLDMTTLQMVYMRLTAGDKIGDIRDFFPQTAD